MKIAIVGAGIGGLTVAALLQEAGHEIKVYEKDAEVREIGAGIGIGYNVIQKLGKHDLAKGIKNAGLDLNNMAILDENNRTLSNVKMKENTLNLTLPRQTLLEIIYSYVDKENVYTNHKVNKIENNKTKVELHFDEQSSETFDLCIGADGINSVVRQEVAPESKKIYQGYTCYRGMVDDIYLKNNDTAYEYWGKKGRVGIVPMLNHSAYWFITLNCKANDDKYNNFEKPHLQAYFNNYPEIVRQVLDKQSETGIIQNDIYDLKPLKSFVSDRVVLIGDAAHATTPNMGQGASQAMEDAIVLVNCLESYDFKNALDRYNQLRVKHTTKVIKKSRKIGKIAQKQNTLIVKMRNMVLKRIPKFLLARQTHFIYKAKDK